MNHLDHKKKIIEIFKSVKRIFDLENPKHKPATTSFKTTVKRTV